MVHHVGVGDVFVIAGRAMPPAGPGTPWRTIPSRGERAAPQRLGPGIPSAGRDYGAVYVGHYENHNPGHSPWLHFAKAPQTRAGLPHRAGALRLRRRRRCAGGTRRRTARCCATCWSTLDGLTPRGGPVGAGRGRGGTKTARRATLRGSAASCAIRAKCWETRSCPSSPCRSTAVWRGPSEALDRQWGHGARGPAAGALCAARVAAVPSADLALYDFIHNAAASNLVVGERCARAALAVSTGGPSTGRPRSRKRRGSSRRIPFFADLPPHPQLAQPLRGAAL